MTDLSDLRQGWLILTEILPLLSLFWPSMLIYIYYRYDARLLLSSLPRQDSENHSLVDPGSVSSPPSPSGWSDLPSDSEDTFFFTASETSDFRRNKRRRLLDAAQSVRLKSLRERDGVDSEEVGKEMDPVWGDDDEEPDEAQAELMRRTARHVVTSPDPVVLEMRILANHGNDGRFAFLRGRWKHRWQRMKALAKAESEVVNAADNAPSVGLNLADYGDSEEEQSDEDSGDADLRPRAEMKAPSPPAIDPEEEAKAARRARAKEWSARRQADKAMLKTEGKRSAKSSET